LAERDRPPMPRIGRIPVTRLGLHLMAQTPGWPAGALDRQSAIGRERAGNVHRHNAASRARFLPRLIPLAAGLGALGVLGCATTLEHTTHEEFQSARAPSASSGGAARSPIAG